MCLSNSFFEKLPEVCTEFLKYPSSICYLVLSTVVSRDDKLISATNGDSVKQILLIYQCSFSKHGCRCQIHLMKLSRKPLLTHQLDCEISTAENNPYSRPSLLSTFTVKMNQ